MIRLLIIKTVVEIELQRIRDYCAFVLKVTYWNERGENELVSSDDIDND